MTMIAALKIARPLILTRRAGEGGAAWFPAASPTYHHPIGDGPGGFLRRSVLARVDALSRRRACWEGPARRCFIHDARCQARHDCSKPLPSASALFRRAVHARHWHGSDGFVLTQKG